jgi:hypothetical protein
MFRPAAHPENPLMVLITILASRVLNFQIDRKLIKARKGFVAVLV